MEIACRLMEYSQNIEGVMQWPFKALASAIEVIPRTLAQNCGADVVRVMTELRAKHATSETNKEGLYQGIDGNAGKIADMRAANIWDPIAVKQQTFKTSIEAACMLLRIDDIVSGIKKDRSKPNTRFDEDKEGGEDETFGDNRDG